MVFGLTLTIVVLILRYVMCPPCLLSGRGLFA